MNLSAKSVCLYIKGAGSKLSVRYYLMRLGFCCLCILFSGIQLLMARPGKGQSTNDIYIVMELKNEPLTVALKKIEQASHLFFAYQPRLVSSYNNIILPKATRTVTETLHLILDQTELAFRQSGSNIIIYKKEEIPGNISEALLPVSGKVLSAQGGPVAGASITIKGSNTGTSSDKEGLFTINIPANGATLIVSCVGYQSREILYSGQASLVITLEAVSQEMNEVVVTSFGVKQNKKGLSYSIQNVKGDELVKSRQPNIVNGLQGKVAGLQITNSGGVPGASASILLRGGTSLDGNNEPLFVIDGIPMDNSTIAEPSNGGGQLARTVSNTNRAFDINPNDIESVSVLKGPAAAALYGLRASGGAIVITTKKGVAGQSRIDASSEVEIQTANKLPETQAGFKRGTGGVDLPSRLSWGPAVTNSDTLYDNMKEFFKNGTLYTNNLSFTGGNEKATLFASISNTHQKGIIPNTDFDRTSFRINSDASLFKGFRVAFTSNYIATDGRKPLQGPGVLNGTGGVMASILYWPRNDNMANYLNADGSRRRLVPNIQEDIDNPYWSVENNPVNNKLKRFIGSVQASYDAASWLNLTYRLGTDFYKEDYQSIRTPGTSLAANANGGLYEADNFYQITTSTFLATLKAKLVKDISASLLLGHNAEWNSYRNNAVFGTNFINPAFVSINNTSTKTYNQFLSERKLVGAFADLQLNYRSWLFINATGRNDWSSTLPESNRSFFYPSLGTSIVLTELLRKPSAIINYAKIRATYAKVGKDAPPHKLSTTLLTQSGIVLGNDFGYGFYSNNAALKPEFTSSAELGAEFQFLNRRLGLDITWYKMQSKDQITQPRVSQGTGFIFKLVNGGTIENKGLEISVNALPVKTKNFDWNINANWSYNRATVTDLPVGTSVFRNSDAIAVFDLAEGASFLGGDLYALRGSTYITNDAGQVIIGTNGLPTVNKGNQKDLGVSRQPDWIAGITNTFTYKAFNLSFLVDMRKGGTIFNGTEYELVKSGLSTKTLDRGTTAVLPGVVANNQGGFTPNATPVVLDQAYFTTIYAENAANFLEDGSWYRLRYITLTYSLPGSLLRKTPVKDLSINITAKNLVLITDYSGFDPELSSGGAGVKGTGTVGIDYMGFPSTKGISIGLRASF